MPTISFIATANSAIYNNAQPLFIDINKEFSLDEKNASISIQEYIQKKWSCLQ